MLPVAFLPARLVDACWSGPPDTMTATVIAHHASLSAALQPLDQAALNLALVAVPHETPWLLPVGARAMLVDQTIAATGGRDSATPPGWPGNLEWLHLRSTGIDKVPRWFFDTPLVTVSRGASAKSIAEYVLGTMLDAEWSLSERLVTDRAGWTGSKAGTLFGKTLGLVGFGHIGKEIAQRALGFEMQVVAARRSAGTGFEEGVEIATLDEVLRRSDHLVLAAPLTEETRGLIDAEAFSAMRPAVHLVNVGRGALLNECAFKTALDSGIVGRASLDVFDPEPPPAGHWAYGHPRLRLTPHISSSTDLTEQSADALLRENAVRFAQGQVQALHAPVSLQDGY